MKKCAILILIFALLPIFCLAASAGDSTQNYRLRASDKTHKVSRNDIKAEIRFGKEVAARILGKFRLYDDEKATRYVNLIGKGLASYSSRPEIEFRFAVIDTDMINAFAAPGGYIFITKGTLETIDNESQLAGVIAHEITHVTEKHIVRELNIRGSDDSALSGLSSVLAGGSSETMRAAFMQMVDKAQEILFEKGLKKEDELSSDRMSVILLGNAGYDPSAYSDLLKKIRDTEKEKKNIKVVSSTHPDFNERLKAVSKTIETEGLTDVQPANTKNRYIEYVSF